MSKGTRERQRGNRRSGYRPAVAASILGYPITPQTEVAEYMAKRVSKVGGLCLQAEKEIASPLTSPNLLGASAVGARGRDQLVVARHRAPKSEGHKLISSAPTCHALYSTSSGAGPRSRRHPARAVRLQPCPSNRRVTATRTWWFTRPRVIQEIVDLTAVAFDVGEPLSRCRSCNAFADGRSADDGAGRTSRASARAPRPKAAMGRPRP